MRTSTSNSLPNEHTLLMQELDLHPTDHFCGLCQATVCRDDLTTEPYEKLKSPLSDVVQTTARPKE